MISICASTFDLSGHIQFTPVGSSSDGEYVRRVSRAATLDTGVSISDRGYSEGDKTLTYSFKPVSKEHDARAKRLVRLHPTVTVSNGDGVFEAVPQSFLPTTEENTFTLLVIRKLSGD
jgi:hypothetical protein